MTQPSPLYECSMTGCVSYVQLPWYFSCGDELPQFVHKICAHERMVLRVVLDDRWRTNRGFRYPLNDHS